MQVQLFKEKQQQKRNKPGTVINQLYEGPQEIEIL